jgi:hypothetical protein
MRNILASLGMWLTRRFGTVRPGDRPFLHPDGEGKISPEEGAALFQRLARLRSMGIAEKSAYENIIEQGTERVRCILPVPFGWTAEEFHLLLETTDAKLIGRDFRGHNGSPRLWIDLKPLLVGRAESHEAATLTEAKP